MKKTKLFFGTILISAAFLTSCSDEPEEIEKTTTIATISANAEDSLITPDGRFHGGAHSGQYIYRTDSAYQYAATMRYDINDSLINSSLRVIINFWAKADNPIKGDGIAISFQDDEQSYIWANIDPIAFGAKPNEWLNIIDSVTIPSDKVSKKGLFFKFFAYNPNKKAIMDIDDINIKIKKVEKVTK